MPTQFKDQDKAERILKAAYTVVAREGFTRATISEIADEARMSRGLLHYYFKNKEDIMARVAGVSSRLSLRLIEDMFQGDRSPGALAEKYCAALEYIAQGDQDFVSVLIESWSVSRRSESVGAEVRGNYRLFREVLMRELSRAAEQGVIAPLLPPRELGAVLVGLFDGIGLQMTLEPGLARKTEIIDQTRVLVTRLLGG